MTGIIERSSKSANFKKMDKMYIFYILSPVIFVFISHISFRYMDTFITLFETARVFFISLFSGISANMNLDIGIRDRAWLCIYRLGRFYYLGYQRHHQSYYEYTFTDTFYIHYTLFHSTLWTSYLSSYPSWNHTFRTIL